MKKITYLLILNLLLSAAAYAQLPANPAVEEPEESQKAQITVLFLFYGDRDFAHCEIIRNIIDIFVERLVMGLYNKCVICKGNIQS